MRKRGATIAVAVGASVLALVALVAFVVWPRGADPVSEEEANADFRSRAARPETSATRRVQRDETTTGSGSAADRAVTTLPGGSSAPSAGNGEPAHGASSGGAPPGVTPPGPATVTAPPRTTPPPGVYTFTAAGQESVKLGPLPAELRPYPATVTLVVVDAGPNCFMVTLNLLAQHGEDTTYCVAGSGAMRIQSHAKRQSIGALRPTATMGCDPAVLYDPGRATNALTCRLTVSAGPIGISAHLAGTSRSSRGGVAAAGQTIDALLLEVHHDMSGDLSGAWSERVWFAATDRMPLRIERSFNLNGLATFVESSVLTLVSLEPAR